MHPFLVCAILLVAVGVLQNIFAPKRPVISSKEMQGLTIGVVLVVPPKQHVEPIVSGLLHSAARPECVRFYVAKLCDPGEDQLAIQDVKIRVSTRVHYVRARFGDAARLRARLLPDVLETYCLMLDSSFQAEMGWDDTLIGEWQAARDKDGALTTRLASHEAPEGFLTVDAMDDRHNATFGWIGYACVPKRPQPSLCASANFLFARTVSLLDTWPSVDSLNGADEDATVTAHLWMSGTDFYAPASMPLWRAPGTPNTDAPSGLMRMPPHRGPRRSQAELLHAMGIRRGRVTSRGKTGISQNATASERFAKCGETFVAHRDL
tara:strand:+ start:11896 stop:12858 length:963 start_codon:yes stop_codon:yes gene_type:complete